MRRLLLFMAAFSLVGSLVSGCATTHAPVRLGSPTNAFGNDVAGYPTCYDPTTSCFDNTPKTWAAIQGSYTRRQDGDPYITKCSGDTVSPQSTCVDAGAANGAQNALYRKSGYLWGIDVPASAVGTPITVQIYDPMHNPCGSTNGGNMLSEGIQGNDCSAGSPSYMPTQYELFDSDGSDLTIDTSAALSMSGKCSTGPGERKFTVADATNATELTNTKNKWYTLCTFTPTKSGIHPLRVKTSDIPGITDTGGGYNAYSLRATPSATGVRTYALSDMSIWNPNNGSTAKFYLAEIGPEHKGRKVVLDLYDAGDGLGSSAFTMQFRTPPGLGPGTPPVVPGDSSGTTSCLYNSLPNSAPGGATPQSSGDCTITTKSAGTSGGIYNGGWLRIEIQIPTTYNCTTDCWWSVWYTFGAGNAPTERTVWTIQVIDEPVP